MQRGRGAGASRAVADQQPRPAGAEQVKGGEVRPTRVAASSQLVDGAALARWSRIEKGPRSLTVSVGEQGVAERNVSQLVHPGCCGCVPVVYD